MCESRGAMFSSSLNGWGGGGGNHQTFLAPVFSIAATLHCSIPPSAPVGFGSVGTEQRHLSPVVRQRTVQSRGNSRMYLRHVR
jgi:hypothetical protein